MSENVLVHHGILGQKWGVRRYQNEDGTLTKAGKKRYAKNSYEEAKYAKAVRTELEMQRDFMSRRGQDTSSYESTIKKAKAAEEKYTKKALKAKNEFLSEYGEKNLRSLKFKEDENGISVSMWGKREAMHILNQNTWSDASFYAMLAGPVGGMAGGYVGMQKDKARKDAYYRTNLN